MVSSWPWLIYRWTDFVYYLWKKYGTVSSAFGQHWHFYFTGRVKKCVILNPICDLIIGNIEGIHRGIWVSEEAVNVAQTRAKTKQMQRQSSQSDEILLITDTTELNIGPS